MEHWCRLEFQGLAIQVAQYLIEMLSRLWGPGLAACWAGWAVEVHEALKVDWGAGSLANDAAGVVVGL